jgi:hypothetical protein
MIIDVESSHFPVIDAQRLSTAVPIPLVAGPSPKIRPRPAENERLRSVLPTATSLTPPYAPGSDDM